MSTQTTHHIEYAEVAHKETRIDVGLVDDNGDHSYTVVFVEDSNSGWTETTIWKDGSEISQDDLYWDDLVAAAEQAAEDPSIWDD